MSNYSNKHFQPPMPAYPMDNDSELSLHDILTFLKTGWKWIASGAAAGLIAGAAYVLFAPEKFLATANIQVATVATDPVETPATLAEKLKMPLFYSTAVYTACGLSDLDRPGETLVKGLKPAVNRNAPMVSISFESNTAASATQCLNAVVNQIREKQSQLAGPVIAGKNAQLEALRTRLKEAEQLEHDFGSKRLHAISTTGNTTQSALLLSALASNDLAIKALITEISELELSLREPQTRTTALATSIYTREVLTPSKRALIAFAVMLAGTFLGLGMLLLRNAWMTAKNERFAGPIESFGFELKGQQFVLRNKQNQQCSEEREKV